MDNLCQAQINKIKHVNNQKRRSQDQRKMSQICLEDLPYEILLEVLSYLPLSDLLNLSQTNKNFNDVVQCELASGRILVDIVLDYEKLNRYYKIDPRQIVENFPNVSSLSLKNFDNDDLLHGKYGDFKRDHLTFALLAF